MRKLCVRIILIFASAIFMFILCNVVYYKCGKPSRLVAYEVYDAIDKAGTNEGYTKVVLGDSVARQIFDPEYQEENDDICYLATNQAIMTLGNYMLLERFIENNSQLEEVYYIARPDSLLGGINFKFTYSYFVTPLYREPFTEYLEPETREEIENTFGSFFAKREFPKWLLAKYPKLLEIYQNGCGEMRQLRYSMYGSMNNENMSIFYVRKMQELCEENNIELHLLASPVPESYQFNSAEIQTILERYYLEEFYSEYASSILKIKDEEFVDMVHLNAEFLEEKRLSIWAKLISRGDIEYER